MMPLAQPLAMRCGAAGAVVQKAFSQRRKILRNCLAGMFTEADLTGAGIDPQARAETVGVEGYVALANLPEEGD